MRELSRSFEQAFRFTFDKTVQHQEQPTAALLPEYADYFPEGEPGQELRAVWGSISDVRVFSGVVTEGGAAQTITLTDGSEATIRVAGHLNVDRVGGPIIKHLFDYEAGVVYQKSAGGYGALDDSSLETLINELYVV